MRKDSNPATKADIDRLFVEIRSVREQVVASEQEVKRYADVKHEKLVHDFQGIFKDRLEVHKDRLTAHEDRIVRLERHLGLLV